MSDAHEKFLADLLGGERQRNSGAVWSRPMDVRNDTDMGEFCFAVDGKSTFGESIGVSLNMWEKAVEQSHDLRPALALRWYSTWHLDVAEDLIVLSAQDFAALLEAARATKKS